MQAGRGQRVDVAAAGVDAGHLLHFDTLDADLAHLRFGRRRGAGAARGIRDIEETEGLAVGAPFQAVHVAGQMGEALGCSLRGDVHHVDVVLLALFHAFRLAGAIGEEGQVLRIRRPGDRGLAAALARGDAMGVSAVGVGHFEYGLAVGLHRPGEVLRIRRQGHRFNGTDLAQGIEDGRDARIVRGLRWGIGKGMARAGERDGGGDPLRTHG